MKKKQNKTKRKCNSLPAFNSYPVASYISKAATSVPLSDHYFFLFLFCAHKGINYGECYTDPTVSSGHKVARLVET